MKVQIGVDAGPGADMEEVASLAGSLRSELLDLDVEDVALVRAGSAPPGAKGVDMVAAGQLVVSILTSGVVAQVAGALRAWLGRDSNRHLRIEIDGDVLDVDHATAQQQQQLIETWLARHANA
jgi:hypothetical protein